MAFLRVALRRRAHSMFRERREYVPVGSRADILSASVSKHAVCTTALVMSVPPGSLVGYGAILGA
jgi:hypothetical protein